MAGGIKKDIRIVGYNSYGHDGGIAILNNGKLEFSIESEKDNHERFAPLYKNRFIDLIRKFESPDVLTMFRAFHQKEVPYFLPRYEMKIIDDTSGSLFLDINDADRYKGLDLTIFDQNETIDLFGKKTLLFKSTHERAHIMSSYGMSPFPQGQPCYALCWEGGIGSFYFIDKNVKIELIKNIMNAPGMRYVISFIMADFQGKGGGEDAGKVMAISAFGSRTKQVRDKWMPLVNEFLSYDPTNLSNYVHFEDRWPMLENSSLFKIGVEHQDHKDFCHLVSTEIFNRFYKVIKENVKPKKYPLLISGGCGLNCDWNTMWKNSGLFTDVFIPPTPNDSGQAIGHAVDAQFYHTGNAKIEWTPYAGEEFIDDME